jgi:hemoglobin/transferrin/lactoferrin receptor protein
LIGDENLGGSVASFYNRYKNFIDESPAIPTVEYPLGVTEMINRDNVEIYGFELSAHYKHASGWHGWGKGGVYVGRDIDEDIHLNTIPPAKLVLGAGYATEAWGADLIFTAAAERDEVENANSETPAYTLLDFTMWWAPPQVKGLTFRAGIYNIFDETYYEDGLDLADGVPQERYSEPGRNFRVSATYKY